MEIALLKRLEDFRTANTDENTVLNFFDEREVHPLTVSTSSNTVDQAMAAMVKFIGKPHNYGPSDEQLLEMKQKDADEKVGGIDQSTLYNSARWCRNEWRPLSKSNAFCVIRKKRFVKPKRKKNGIGDWTKCASKSTKC